MPNSLIQSILTRRFGGLPVWVDVASGMILPVLAGGKGNPPSPPPPDPTEQRAKESQLQILENQLRLAKEQEERMNQFMPLLLRESGYDITPGNTAGEGEQLVTIGGVSYRIGKSADTRERERLNKEISTESAQRSLKALRGELAVDPAVEQDLTRGQQQLEEELLRRLGPGWKESDAGRRAMGEFERQANSIRYQVRHGELTAGNAMSLNAQNQQLREAGFRQGGVSGLNDPYAMTAGLLGQGGNTAAALRQQGLGDRSFNFNANFGAWKAQSDADAALLGGALGGGLSAAGSIGGAIIL